MTQQIEVDCAQSFSPLLLSLPFPLSRWGVFDRVSTTIESQSFTITSPSRELHLRCDTEKERDLWIQGLQIMIQVLKAELTCWNKAQAAIPVPAAAGHQQATRRASVTAM